MTKPTLIGIAAGLVGLGGLAALAPNHSTTSARPPRPESPRDHRARARIATLERLFLRAEALPDRGRALPASAPRQANEAREAAPPGDDSEILAQIQACRALIVARERALQSFQRQAAAAERRAFALDRGPALSLTEGWAGFGVHDWPRELERLQGGGFRARPALLTLLDTAGEVTFLRRPQLASLRSSFEAPNLRTAVILRLGELSALGDGPSLTALRAFLSEEAPFPELLAAAFALDPAGDPGCPDRPAIIAALRRGLVGETEEITGWRRARDDFARGLPEPERTAFGSAIERAGPNATPLLRGPALRAYVSWLEAHPKPRSIDGLFCELGELGRRYGTELLPELRARARGGLRDAVSALAALPSSSAIAELVGLIDARPRPGDRVACAALPFLAGFDHPAAYSAISQRAPMLPPRQRRAAVEGFHRRLCCFDSREEAAPSEAEEERALTCLDALEHAGSIEAADLAARVRFWRAEKETP